MTDLDEKDTKQNVTKFINGIKAAIKRDYGIIPPEWSAQIVQLEDLFKVYNVARHALYGDPEQQVIMKNNRGATMQTNPYFSVMQICVEKMDKLVKQFGLSPYSSGRINQKTASTSSDTDEYLDNL